ncbi:hypothetical protein O0L34_g3896 [Tuta absoluta]|nr:hypothetical protein O0L34_g3896 [Tuta absoluta]
MFRKEGPSKYIFAFVIVLLQGFSTCNLVIKEEIPFGSLLSLHTKNEESNKQLMKESLETDESFIQVRKLKGEKPKSRLWTEEEIQKFKLWPRGVIPYYIDDLSFDKVFRDRIRSFLEQTTDKTGLQFVEMPSPPDNQDDSRWVFFINRRGALKCPDLKISDLTNKGAQRVVLGYDCLASGGELAATVLALAGVPPQHNAPDRDKYIKISFENVIPEKNELFRVLPKEQWPFKDDSNYDFASAGHYHSYKYTKNGKMTIQHIHPTHGFLHSEDGDAKEFSPTDISKLKFLYHAISQKPEANISEDCSKIYKLGVAEPDDKLQGDLESHVKRKRQKKVLTDLQH